MEKLKNIFSPGHQHDDEVLYGSGKSDDPVLQGNDERLDGQGAQLEKNPVAEHGRNISSVDSTGAGLNDMEEASYAQGETNTTSSPEPQAPHHAYGSTRKEVEGPRSNSAAPADIRQESIDEQNTVHPTRQEREEGTAAICQTTTARSYPLGTKSDITHYTPTPPDETEPEVQAQSSPEAHGNDNAAGPSDSEAFGVGTDTATQDKSSTHTSPTASRGAKGSFTNREDSVGQGNLAGESPELRKSTSMRKPENPYQSSHIDPRIDSDPRSKMRGTYEHENPIGLTERDNHYSPDTQIAATDNGMAGVAVYGAQQIGNQSKSGSARNQTSDPTNITSAGTPEQYTPQPSNQPSSAMPGSYVAGTDAKVPDQSPSDCAPKATGLDNPRTDKASTNQGPKTIPVTSKPLKVDDNHHSRPTGMVDTSDPVSATAYSFHREDENKSSSDGYEEDKPLTSKTRDTAAFTGVSASSMPAHQFTTANTLGDNREATGGQNGAVAGAGVGTGSYGADDYSKHQAKDSEKDWMQEEPARQKQFEMEREAQEKAAAKQAKEHEKEMKKEEKANEKSIKEYEKKQAAAIAAQEKERKKELRSREKEQDSMIVSQEKERQADEERHSKGQAEQAAIDKQEMHGGETDPDKKKRGGFLGLFKRKPKRDGKDDDEKDESHKEEAALGSSGAGGAVGSAHEYQKQNDGIYTTDQPNITARDHVTDKTESDRSQPHYGDNTTAGVDTKNRHGHGHHDSTPYVHSERNVLRKDPPLGVYDSHGDTEKAAARETSAYGTEKSQDNPNSHNRPDKLYEEHETEHTTTGIDSCANDYSAPSYSPSTSATGPSSHSKEGSGIVTEPRTGLPTNLAHGNEGVDGGPNPGYERGDNDSNVVIEPRTGLPKNLDKEPEHHDSSGTDATPVSNA